LGEKLRQAKAAYLFDREIGAGLMLWALELLFASLSSYGDRIQHGILPFPPEKKELEKRLQKN